MVDYRAKFVLAPMVRIGELPMRLLAMKYGCELVWGPEVIDKKIITCDRVYNAKLDTVDFLSRTGNKKIPGVTDLVFRTYRKLEKDRLIFQMGTANAELAVKAAKVVVDDVDGIDINAGCPKHFSIHSGMGAALLRTPDLLCEILTSLVEEVGKPHNTPISVKIRLLEEKAETLALVSRLVKTGISNLTLHCRTREMRNRENPIRDYVKDVAKICNEAGVTFIVNGQVRSYKDYREIQEKYGKDIGAMIATSAEENPSCFSPEGQVSWPQICKEYLEITEKFNNHPTNTKYTLLRMIPGASPVYQLISRTKEPKEFMNIIENVLEEEKQKEDEKEEKESAKRSAEVLEDAPTKRAKTQVV